MPAAAGYPTQSPFVTIAPHSRRGWRCPLTRRFEYATATVVLLVILRLAIGWHFFKEGVSHHTDPAWSSEGFLRQAKGPLADMYQSVLPDFHGWNRLMLAPLTESHPADSSDAESDEPAAAKEKPSENKSADTKAADKSPTDSKPAEKKKSASGATPAYADWLKAANDDWTAETEKYAEYYHFDQKQKDEANALVKETVRRMKEDSIDEHGERIVGSGLGDEEPDIRIYRLLVARAQAMPLAPGAQQIPNEVARSAAALQNPVGERGLSTQSPPMTTPASWQSNAKAIDQLFHDRLRGLLTDDQRAMADPPNDANRLHRIDTIIGWTLMIVGGCLIVGLFTRLAAVVGALFLLSIICAQPAWLATNVQTYTYNQWVEMLALLTLATTHVGRWCGLDYFISYCCGACCGSRSRTVEVAPRSNLPPGVSMPPGLKKRLS